MGFFCLAIGKRVSLKFVVSTLLMIFFSCQFLVRSSSLSFFSIFLLTLVTFPLQFLVVNDSRMVWQYVFSMSTLIITDIVGGRISLYYPRTYLATRQPLTWIRVLLRLAFSLAYLPRKAFYYLRLTDPPHTHFEFLSILFKVCFLNSLSALGYVLPSFAQIGIAVGCIITSMTSVLTTCNLPALPELEVERQAMHVDLGTWINGCVQRLLPLELGKEEWLPMVHESSCSLVSSWAFATFALAGSLIVSNWNEERLRREFLALEGYFIFMPMVGWQVLHAAVQMAMAAQILWVLLSAVSLWRIIIL